MKYFANQFETKMLNDRAALEEYLTFTKESDRWSTPYPEEIALVGFSNQIEMAQECHPNADFPDFSASLDMYESNNLSCLNNRGIFVAHPGKDTPMELTPSAYCAFPTIVCNAARLSGSGIYQEEDNSAAKAASPELLAETLTKFIRLRTGNLTMLERDGFVASVVTGSYVPLHAYKTIPLVEETLKRDFPEMEYKEGKVSMEYLVADFDLNDEIATDPIRDVLEQAGMTVNSIEAYARYSTSDIGNSKMRLTPILSINGVKIPCGKEVSMVHLKDASEDGFAKKVSEEFGALLRECEEQIEKLGNTEIKNPAACLVNLHTSQNGNRAKIGFITKPVFDSYLPTFQSEFADGCTAMDVYLAICAMAEQTAGDNPTAIVKLLSMAADTMTLDYTAYDKAD